MGQAMLYGPDRVPIIIYDLDWFPGGLSEPLARFAQAHEYGHHRRGHTIGYITLPPNVLAEYNYNSEFEADCFAVRALEAKGDYEAIHVAAKTYIALIPPQGSQGRPGAIDRIANINACSTRPQAR